MTPAAHEAPVGDAARRTGHDGMDDGRVESARIDVSRLLPWPVGVASVALTASLVHDLPGTTYGGHAWWLLWLEVALVHPPIF